MLDRRNFLGALAGAGAMSVLGSAARAAPKVARKPVTDTPVILECAINGSTTKAQNPLAPELTSAKLTALPQQAID